MKLHRINSSNDNLHASFSRDYKPILAIDSGDRVQFQTPDVGWGYSPSKQANRERYQSREKESTWGHPLVGPIEIKGAEPGMVLEIHINEIIAGWYGWNCAGGSDDWHNGQLGIADQEEITLNWELDREEMTGRCQLNGKALIVPLKPFMGVMGMPPAEPGVHSTMPPRFCGGNMDCKELVKGSILYLPIAVKGGLFSVGDGHALQGDGEVSGQAIECPMDLVELQFVLRSDMNLKMPRANTPIGWITFGFDEDLNKATIQALDGMLDLLKQLYGLERADATALASLVVDLRITQIVNGVKGVHAVLPRDIVKGEL
ncbi:acetamidase/formamidase family protein [Paenibacillus sediminis]|uniref:Acetamidase/formamidase n=1 Tax=Paenibacillus sediminis TaxID=664909 RepID=A0ABS4H9C4_9BACL|nr:acetamidase/formamidase family protein [Paenibacillus sediminis]MBP1938650.1 acetamidase/formamidase [Paenibacillus sediminis]